jgi:hypothetical protein
MGAMSKIVVPVKLSSDGPTLFAEVDAAAEAPDDAFGRAADPVEALAAGPRSVDEALATLVVPAARTFMDRLRDVSPDAVDFEFGLNLSGKVGLVFASVGTEAHITVTLRWSGTERK